LRHAIGEIVQAGLSLDAAAREFDAIFDVRRPIFPTSKEKI
jgi:hypothetical protein